MHKVYPMNMTRTRVLGKQLRSAIHHWRAAALTGLLALGLVACGGGASTPETHEGTVRPLSRLPLAQSGGLLAVPHRRQ